MMVHRIGISAASRGKSSVVGSNAAVVANTFYRASDTLYLHTLLNAAATFPCMHQANHQQRSLKSIKVSAKEADKILIRQRLNRPIAPHLSVYKLEQTWLGSSAWMRITGCTLTGAIYVWFASYLMAPVMGWHLDSGVLVGWFADLPAWIKSSVKFGLAFPFAFHFLNGMKQLMFDMVIGYSKRTIKWADAYLWASALASSSYIAFWL